MNAITKAREAEHALRWGDAASYKRPLSFTALRQRDAAQRPTKPKETMRGSLLAVL